MSKYNLIGDIKLVINGLQKVLTTQAAIEKAALETKLHNSSLNVTVKQLTELPKKVLPRDPINVLERASMIPRGIQAYAQYAILPKLVKESNALQKENLPEEDILLIREEDLEGIYTLKSLGVELAQDSEDEGKVPIKDSHSPHETLDSHLQATQAISHRSGDDSTKVFDHNVNLTAKLDDIGLYKQSPHDEIIGDIPIRETVKETYNPQVESTAEEATKISDPAVIRQRDLKPLSKGKPESRLGATSKERKVPASRISRLVSYGGLAAGLGMGALAEVTKRSLGLGSSGGGVSVLDSNPFLNDANAERIVDTLCRVRGAALKLGQILSIQDDTMINPKLQQIFERVRHAADFMPTWQMERIMESEFGVDWRQKLSEFDMKPFAAASIGQVHLGKLEDGRPVAIKVQYPGVAQGIESDIDNLMTVLNVWKILPDGIFAENIIEVAKRELRWEVDYMREMECAKRFRILLQPYPDYYIPEVIDGLTTKLVFTTELIEGIPVDKCDTLDQATRDRICYLMLDLFFRELFEFRFMQTDPNWSNFLYNTETKQIGLLDFGASREYSKDFVDKYLRILKGAATDDLELVLEGSRDIGFLTGYESKTMEKAHVETVMMLGEAFRIHDKPYDFGTQRITQRIQELVPVMVKERLCPPPEEIYSLHRKLSGVFLLCARLKGKVRCRPIFERVWNTYEFGSENKLPEPSKLKLSDASLPL